MPPLITIADPVLMERTIAGAIQAIWETLPLIGNVYARERFARDDEEDVALFTTDDPVVGVNRPITNVVEIGLPEWDEFEYTSDLNTQVIFTYPIDYTLGVTDVWDNPYYEFGSSGEQFIGTMMRARLAFKSMRDLGLGQNVVHDYLQGGRPTFRTNDKGEASEHYAEMTLAVTVSGIQC